MSGDQRTDGPDPLDDDFVIEDLAGKNDDLESLFTAPANPKPPAPPGGEPADADDVLFTDHTQGVKPSEKFQEGAAFAEQGKSQWNGDNLELDQAGAKDGQNDELAEEEFGPDSEKELELVDGGGTTDGVNEFEQSGPFVLDDSEGAWQDDSAAAAAEGEGTEAAEGEGVEPALVEDEAPVEPGWEPLPEGSVDELSEVGEVARTDDEAGGEPMQEGEEAALVGADVDGHDIYAEDAPAALVGPRPAGRRVLRLLTSLAASLLLLAGGAVVVMRPEWFGLAFEPARVQQVRIERPQVQVAVNTPPAPQPAKPVTQPTGPKQPVAVVPPPVEVPTVPQPEKTPEPQPEPAPVTPVSTSELKPTPVVTEAPLANEWPVKEGRVGEQTMLTGREKQRTMVRLGDDLMVGEVDVDKRPVRPVDGVMPGSRAFAQLHNGNYFIGAVKHANDVQVTLRLDAGEITIARVELARLTELGSADYEQLQRVTSGFVRLTNNNRLVGGILSQIADDHIVLEFRSNRVMLPKSAVGQVVRGDDEGDVRLDVTPQEDDWLKTIAERQLGSGTAPGTPPAGTTPAPREPATRPTTPPAALPAAPPTTGATPPPARPR